MTLPSEAAQTAGWRACPLRKQQHRAPRRQPLGAGDQNLLTVVVRDVAGGANDTREEGVRPGLALHDTVGLGHAADEQHHVDQRGVVGDDDGRPTGRQGRQP